jgi:uncharacterized BrkB/YihY/UPF0761 family membrane protein
MVWYFAKLSMVNVIYGAMAATIVVLLTLEAAAVILLFGGEVIAEIDRGRIGRARGRRSGADGGRGMRVTPEARRAHAQ